MNILITGGTGLVGARLSALLTQTGHSVAYLTRGDAPAGVYQTFRWSLTAGTLDPAAVPWADAIVHLAGAGVVDERWTDARKREILTSRVQGLELLGAALAKGDHRVKTLVSASAIGLYGDGGNRLQTEVTPPPPPGQDFLADVCRAWETAAVALRGPHLNVPILRLGIVLSADGGALPEIARPVKLGAGAALGSGKQWMSWVHLDDVCAAFIEALTNPAYADAVLNVVAPHPVTNAAFTRAVADALHRPLVLPAVPAFALRLALGERAQVVLASQKVDAGALRARGFAFRFPELEPALANLYAPTRS